MRSSTIQKILERIRKEEEAKAEFLKSHPWAPFFGDYDTDPCFNIKKPEGIPEALFYEICYKASQWTWWFDEQDQAVKDAWWSKIYALNATGRSGEGLFDEA